MAGHPDDEVPGERVVASRLGGLHGNEVVLLCPLMSPEVAAGVGGQARGVSGGVEQGRCGAGVRSLAQQRGGVVMETGDIALESGVRAAGVGHGAVHPCEPAQLGDVLRADPVRHVARRGQAEA